ncbi:hypothetical protein BGP_6235 [Beggiatoa sp. PS]|nr:hypothetical protein BGP_6235 [Beggiatoa sp. PS]
MVTSAGAMASRLTSSLVSCCRVNETTRIHWT